MTTEPHLLPGPAGCEFLAAGRDWDAIRVPRTLGLDALDILGARSGAVVDDPRQPALYWFVAVGAAGLWEVDEARPLGAGNFVAVPPPRRTQGPGPYWRICPAGTNWLTNAAALQAAVEDALLGGRAS